MAHKNHEANKLSSEEQSEKGLQAKIFAPLAEKPPPGFQSSPIPLILDLQPLNRDEYQDRFGALGLEHDPFTSAAEKIASLSFNPEALELKSIEVGDCLSLTLFDGDQLYTKIENVTYSSTGLTMRGLFLGNPGSSFAFSMINNQVLASIRLPEKNRQYLIKYMTISGEHFLFMAYLDQVEVLKDEAPPDHLALE